jgi:spore coat protein U-like protein
MSTGATLTARNMTDPGSALLRYGLFSNSAGTINSGPSAGAAAIPEAGSGSAQAFAMREELSTKHSAQPPAYVDVMVVTVIY